MQQDVVLGELNPNNAAYVLEQLRRSADYAMSGKSVGVATAPVQKSVINEAGISLVVILSITRNLPVFHVWS